MGRLIHLRGDPHEETQRLLPWYVTGRLDATDRLLADTHLATCAECREELAFERRLSGAVHDLPMAADEPWERFAATLASRPAPRQREDRRWWRQPVRVAWFAGAQAAVVLLCIGIVTTRRAPAPDSAPAYRAPAYRAPAYRALGDAPVVLTGNLLVMFAAGTSDQAVRGAIGAAHARLVRGPTTTGAYVLAVAPGDRATALARLKARRDVTMAQPIDAPAP